MHPLQFNTVKLSLCLILGILLGNLLQLSIFISLISTLFTLLLLGIVFRHQQKLPSWLFGVLAACVTVCVGQLSFSLTQSKNFEHHYSHLLQSKNQSFIIKIREILKPNAYSQRFVARVKFLDTARVSGKILLSMAPDTANTQLKVDDELMVFSTATPIKAPLNPHQFNYKKYLSHLGIEHQLYLSPDNSFITPNTSRSIFGVAAQLRQHIIKKLKKAAFGKEELGVIQALLLGQRHDISPATNTDYKDAGAYHILALSGLHIGILLGLLHFLLSPLEFLPKGRTIKLAVIVLLLWGFAILAGLSPSILRAVTMFSFVAYALYLNRPTSHFNILALSLFFILLLLDPLLLFQVGFQLSYAAVFAIVLIFPLLQKLWAPKNYIIKKSWELLSVSLAAQLGVFPISLFYFHQFPGLFFVSSLIVLPFLTFILGFGILVIVLALSNSLPPVVVAFYDSVIWAMNSTIGYLAQQEGFLFRNIPFDTVQLFLSYAIILTLVLLLIKTSYKKTLLFLGFILCFQFYILAKQHHSKSRESLTIGHLSRNTALLHRRGSKLTIFTNHPPATQRIASDYAIAQHTRELEYLPLRNSYTIEGERIVVMDSVYNTLPKNYKVTTLVLTHSPKINLDRLLDWVQPKTIIADGSNYKSYIKRWKASCRAKKIPFHYTGEKGAFDFFVR
ncbi:ComEC family competence protein [Arenibacter aquaticus]|uniref:ComEC family competence protein n=2 Tax=Arenibacter aquaticus TaxID=2489054 RepID=A0A3S0AG48_9FLAO|nr:ComEC family competence protein [Arenibacter aquaticus]